MANNNNKKGTPAHLREARLQRIRADEEELERMRLEELRRNEEERVRIQNGVRAMEVEQERVRLEQEQRIREEQEARAARVVEDARLRGMQQSVAGASDHVIDGVGSIFNDSSSGAWNVRSLPPPRRLTAFSADAFTDKRAARDERRHHDDALWASRKAKRLQDSSFDDVVEGVHALLDETTSGDVALTAATGVEEVERRDVNDINAVDYSDDEQHTADKDKPTDPTDKGQATAKDEDNDEDEEQWTDADSEDDNRDSDMDTNEHDGRGGEPPSGETAQLALTGPSGVQTAPASTPPPPLPLTHAPQVAGESPTPHVTPAADPTIPARSPASSDATLEIPSLIDDLSKVSPEQAIELVRIFNSQVMMIREKQQTAIYHQKQLRLRAERDALHPQADRRVHTPTQRIYDELTEESEVSVVETRETLQLAKIIKVRTIGVSADLGNGTLQDVTRCRASNQRKRRREGASRRIAEAARNATGSGADQRQVPAALDLPRPNPVADRRDNVGKDNVTVEVLDKRRKIVRSGPSTTSSSLSSTVMEAASTATSTSLPPVPAINPPPPPSRRSRDISPIRGPTVTTTTTIPGGTVAGGSANLPPPPPPPAIDDQQRQGGGNANSKKKNRRPKRKASDASTSNRSSTSAASAFPPPRRLPRTPEDLLTPEMLAIAIKLPDRPRSREIQTVIDILPADFYPNCSPLDRALYAADAAVDKDRAGKKLRDQYNFKMKVAAEHDEQVAMMTKFLVDAKKEADRVRAEAHQFWQPDGQQPSTSGTQRHSASTSNNSSSSSQRPTPCSNKRDDPPSYRGGKGGRGKGRKQ